MTMTSPLRGPKSPEGGGFAAAHPSGAPRRVRGRPEPDETDELAFDKQEEENHKYRRRTLESVKHHLRPNRQRSVGPRHCGKAVHRRCTGAQLGRRRACLICFGLEVYISETNILTLKHSRV